MRHLLILLCGMALLSCNSGRQTAMQLEKLPDKGPGTAYYLPKAPAFRMSGDYADRVAVTLNADGSLAYYPAPSDITAQSAPLEIGDGWWLNRQGMGANSVFTKWTFAEDGKLPKAPSPEEIKASLLPGARVTDFEQLPVSPSDAAADPASCLQYIK